MNEDKFSEYSLEEEEIRTPQERTDLDKQSEASETAREAIETIPTPEKHYTHKGDGYLVSLKGVDIERADKVVLRDVDFSISPGEFVYLVGKVGSGKSSLMKSIYADVPLRHGKKAEVLGFDLLNLKRRQTPYLRRKIGIVFQDFQLLTDRSANENLRFVLRATGWKDRREIEQRVEEVLTAVGMEKKGYKMPHELSGGEQQRIVIARALLNHPDLILADEPTGNLDPQTGYNIVKLLHELSQKGQAILMATHNLQLVDDFPARVVRCRDKHLE